MDSAVQPTLNPLSILFVCAGNICRSPALQAILQQQLHARGITAYVESCGLHSSFIGSDPDTRMQAVAKQHGIILENHAKLFEDSFFEQFDWIFCATQDILESVKHMAHQKEFLSKIHLATHFAPAYYEEDIPDPYFREVNGFEDVWEMMVTCSQGIIDALFTPSL